MSHNNVNASLSKSLIQHLVRWVIKSEIFDAETGVTLGSILDTVISPELVPADEQGQIQSHEDKIGPYDLHDFFLYYITRFGLKPSKVAYLAHAAWHSRDAGSWPSHFPEASKRQFDLPAIKRWLDVFSTAFHHQSVQAVCVAERPEGHIGNRSLPAGIGARPRTGMRGCG